jgi:CRISPR/Cas system-associated exonuclease Cas4 (RecB family)
MRKFIDEIVDLYLNDENTDALNTCIITPNKRAHRFINKAIKDNLKDGGFLPGVFSIDDFIFNHIPWLRIDEVDLTYVLFDVFKSLEKKEEIDFDDFLGYSSILLHDFNEIDMQMADGKDIFSYLNDAKAIQQWNPDGSPLSASQKEYLRFYNHLADVYLNFRGVLFEKGICYQGMAYRYFAENIEEISTKLPWEKIIFAGFNALTKSEEQMIKAFTKKEIVKTIWDADKYYLDDTMMEAGMYLRKYKSWNSAIEKQSQNHLLSPNKTIEITGVPGVLGQVRLAAQIIDAKAELAEDSSLNEDKNQQASAFENNTVIVPADESLLLPLLNSLPTRVLKNTNITMGFSIQHSHAYRLAESIIYLHLHSSKISSLNKNSRYHKDDLFAVLNNDLIALLNDGKMINPKEISQTFAGQELVNTAINSYHLDSIAQAFESCHNKPEELVQKLRLVFHQILKLNTLENEAVISPEEEDALQQILLVFNRLQSLIAEHKKPNTLQGFYTLYKQLVQGISQSFIGKIDHGLQLMGLLETRLMDFENVMILSTNEDILPASAFSSSFIPSDIRFEFSLPGIQERTAVFAYHFYRLIQRAKNVYLIYSTSKKKMSGGEKSRFIKQIEFELQKYNTQITIKHQLLNFKDLIISQDQGIIINKDETVLKKLDELAKKGLSPTGLISYTKCPLQFYFKYIARVKEPDLPEDIIDGRVIGNVIHKVLENFYKPFVKKDFPYENLKILKKNLHKIIIETYKKEFKGKIDEGPNYLSVKDTEHYLSKFIDFEIQAAITDPSKLIILGVEQNLRRSLAIEIAGKSKEILFKGNADRIDEKNNTIRILDYKTGSVDKKKVKIPKTIANEINPIFINSEYDKALQLYLYHWMYKGESAADAQAGIVSFKLIKAPYIMLNNDIDDDLDDDFKEFISNIFNPDIPFTQTDEIKNCSYCIYKDICSR